MKRLLLSITCTLYSIASWAQCGAGEVALTMNIFTDSWGYETYWEIVPAANPCGVGTVAWGSNIQTVGCTGGGEQNANGSGYPSNTVIPISAICLTEGEFYTLYFVDDYGDGGLTFEMFEDGSYTAIYVGTGIGNSWTFQAGNPNLPPHDSPCNGIEVTAGNASAVELSNIGCVAQMGEVFPPWGACEALGFWCDVAATKTVWAKFVAPDEGAYEISTCNNGTSFDTQIAVWIGDNCSNMSSFQLISANDDSFGGCSVPDCTAEPSACVDMSSAAYNNVIAQIPACCSIVWDESCQNLYDSMSETCLGGSQGCFYTLNGYDSYGDGWNDGFVTITVNGVATNYTFYTGFQSSWLIPVNGNENITLSWSPGGWPEEVSFQLLDGLGNQLLNISPTPPVGIIFTGTTVCQGVAGVNAGASSCFISCLPAGTECYIQIDGYQGQTGKVILTVKPFTADSEISAIVSHTNCPGGFGLPAQGSIIPQITGWGADYSSQWSGPNGFDSEELYLPNINPGDYTLTATDNCGNQMVETFTVLGPAPFFFENSITNSCSGEETGSITVFASGGTAPYSFEWWIPGVENILENQVDSLAAGIYYMLLTDANECAIIQAVEVQEVAFPVFDLGQDLLVCSDYSMILEGPVANQYLWSTGNTTSSIIISAEELGVGVHEIWLIATNEDGCSFIDNISITVETCLIVNNRSMSNLLVYPNPATTWLRINHIPDDAQELSLFNQQGKLIYSKNLLYQKEIQLDINDLPSGIYVIAITGNDSVVQQKVSIIR